MRGDRQRAANDEDRTEAGSESIREGRIGGFRSAGARRVVLRHAGRAVTAAAEAAGYFPDGHPLKSQALLNLGRAHAVRSADTGAADEERRARDAFGRVDLSGYFRPPGATGLITVEAGGGASPGAVVYPSNTNDAFYNGGPNPANLAFPAYLPDVTNNPLHGFEAAKIPPRVVR